MSTPGGWNAPYKTQASPSPMGRIKWIFLAGVVLALLLLGTCGRIEYRQYKLVDAAVARLVVARGWATLQLSR